MACPNIKYGIDTTGTTKDRNINSGREIFRCGDCVKAYIVNVSVDDLNVSFSCENISDANKDNFCMISANGSIRSRYNVNWIAKNNVSSQLDNGYVINKVGDCGGSDGVVFLYTDVNISGRAYGGLDNGENVVKAAQEKLFHIDNRFNCNPQLSDINIGVSPNDWQTISASGFDTKDIDYGIITISFSWNTGIVEKREGNTIYDTTENPQKLQQIIDTLLP